jgi:hypothetical protein
LALSLAAAGFAAKPVEVRTLAGVDFARFETYAWAARDDLVEGHPLREGTALDLRIRAAADALLAARGFERVDRGASPELIINYVGVARDIFESEGVTAEVAPGIKWIGDPDAHAMRSYREGTLVFEVIDSASGEMVWSGWVTELAPSVPKLQAKAEKATRRVFQHFPRR